jgi:1-acyl-sn-glycerol-3-phosphate acyltransferase
MARTPLPLALLRAFRVTLHLLIGLLMAVVVGISLSRLRPEPLARWWYAKLLDMLNIEIRLNGTLADGACMLVSNHVSWLDIPVIGSRMQTRFIAKSEIRDWPIIGWLALSAGAFFIRRGAGGAKPLLERMQPHLDSGGSVALFPEGTTTDGRSVRSFHARIFEAAIVARCPLQPVALRYENTSDGYAVAPFIGDDDFVSHLWRILRTPSLRVHLDFLPQLQPEGERNALARRCEQLVRDRVLAGPGHDNEAQSDFDPVRA